MIEPDYDYDDMVRGQMAQEIESLRQRVQDYESRIIGVGEIAINSVSREKYDAVCNELAALKAGQGDPVVMMPKELSKRVQVGEEWRLAAQAAKLLENMRPCPEGGAFQWPEWAEGCSIIFWCDNKWEEPPEAGQVLTIRRRTSRIDDRPAVLPRKQVPPPGPEGTPQPSARKDVDG